jgi:phosphoglycerate dehydrogenase-like enzyme
VLPAGELHSLLAASDFVAVCSQLTEVTRGMFDKAAFAAMKSGAVLINIARGEEIDEEALLDAFRSGQLAGALLDVHSGESTGRAPRVELQQSPKLLLTPHLSTSGGVDMGGPARELFVRNLRRYLAGEPLLNVVDRQRGY